MKRIAYLLLLASPLLAEPQCAIRGIVVDGIAKAPLARVQVFARPASDSDENLSLPVRQITDAQGAFCFDTLEAGDYIIRAGRAFYVDAAYGEHWPGGHGQKVQVSAAKPASPITIKMMPQATISGTLLDSDGDPLQGGNIELLKASWSEQKLTAAPVDRTTTDDQGRYRFARLAAGTYFISATPVLARERDTMLPVLEMRDQSREPFKEVQGSTYYKDAISFRDATAIRVRAGQEVSNLTLTLQTSAARHISGQVAPEVLNTNPRVVYCLEDTAGPTAWLNIPIQKDGTFRANSLFPDRYYIYAGAAHKEIDLTNGDIDGLVLEPDLPLELQITLHYADEMPEPQIRSLTLTNRTPKSIENDRPMKAEFVSENRFRLNIFSGQYEVSQVGEGLPFFVRKVIFDGDEQRGSLLDLNGGGRKSLELFLSSKAASVEGRVLSMPAQGTAITVLMQRESDPQAPRQRVSSADGRFRCTLTQAGRYRLYAFEDFDEDAWGNPELANLLATKSAVIEVKEGEHLHVELPLITADEFAEAVTKTGY